MKRYPTYPLELLKVSEAITKCQICRPETVYEYMKEESMADREIFWVLHLNTKNRIVKKEMAAMGAVDHCSISIGIVLRGAVACGAAGIITVHNHPSGDPMPSPEDRQLWRTIREACRLLGIRVIDNIVIGADGFYSEEERK